MFDKFGFLLDQFIVFSAREIVLVSFFGNLK